MTKRVLEFLGIAPQEEALYRSLLREGGNQPQGPGTDSYDTAPGRRLVELGLASSGPNGLLRPVPPAKAVEGLVERLVDQRRLELEGQLARTGAVDSLLAEREAAMTSGNVLAERGPGLQHLRSLDEVRAAIDELTFFTRTENFTTNPHGVMSAQNIANSRPLDLRILRRGVRMRTLMGAAALDDPATLAYLRELTGKGAQIRISRRPLELMIICDRAAALTPLDPADTSRGAILTREPGLVAALVSLFERMWDGAQEVPDLSGDTAGADEGLPSEIERKVLASLYASDKDETGARDLGISVRTYRKHVAALMQRLDATNRVQAALLARDRGWL
ncbi:LuxR C-terminal-related transcriptional regulator [Streptomyces sp. NPDC060194]|uniref:helix-turn-helix transcriptional regulator n=1 Tax=Streptomyces sp. NPDC060194 TaxID=3347069 RepID=UPI003663D439